MLQRKKILALCLAMVMLLLCSCNDGEPANSYDDYQGFVDFQRPDESMNDTSSVSTDGAGNTTTVEKNQPGTTTAPTKGTGSKTNATTTTTKSPTTTTTTKKPSPSGTPVDTNLAKGKVLNDGQKDWEGLTDGDVKKPSFAVAEKKPSSLLLDLGQEHTINEVRLYEYGGSKIKECSIYVQNGSGWKLVFKQDEIGAYRICSFPTVNTRKIKIEITDSREDTYMLSEVEVYNATANGYTGDFRVVSYVVSHPSFDREYFKESTDLIFIGETGWDADCNLIFNRSSFKGEADFAALVTDTRKAVAASGKEMRLWCSMGNPGDNTADTMKGAKKDKLIKNLVNFALKYDLDGLDFDWEYPYSNANWRIYSSFLIDLKKELSKHGMLLSTAQGPWGVQLTPEAIAAIDNVNIMSYDLKDGDTGNHASFNNAVKHIQYLLDIGFKPEQLSLGLAFYGVPDWPAYSYFVQKGCDRWQNEMNGIYYNGCQMIRDKTVLAIQEKIGGVMTWHYSCDVEESKTGLSLYDEIREVQEQYLK